MAIYGKSGSTVKKLEPRVKHNGAVKIPVSGWTKQNGVLKRVWGADKWDGTIGTVPTATSGGIAISTGAQLAALAASVNAGTSYNLQYIYLENDIDLGDNIWTPIGTSREPFYGNFYGCGHTITMNDNNTLFGVVGDMSYTGTPTVINVIDGVRVKGSIDASYSSYHVGGIVNMLAHTSEIRNCLFEGTIVGPSPRSNGFSYSIGGIVGFCEGTVQGCVVKATIQTQLNAVMDHNMGIGGIAGALSAPGHIVECVLEKDSVFNLKHGVAPGSVGGIVGSAIGLGETWHPISDCASLFSVNTVSDQYTLGRFIGLFDNFDVILTASDITDYNNYCLEPNSVASQQLHAVGLRALDDGTYQSLFIPETQKRTAEEIPCCCALPSKSALRSPVDYVTFTMYPLDGIHYTIQGPTAVGIASPNTFNSGDIVKVTSLNTTTSAQECSFSADNGRIHIYVTVRGLQS